MRLAYLHSLTKRVRGHHAKTQEVSGKKNTAPLTYEDDPRGVNSEYIEKLRDILATLHAAPNVTDMDLPGFRLHPLKSQMKGFWAVPVRASWRVIFRLMETRRTSITTKQGEQP